MNDAPGKRPLEPNFDEPVKRRQLDLDNVFGDEILDLGFGQPMDKQPHALAAVPEVQEAVDMDVDDDAVDTSAELREFDPAKHRFQIELQTPIVMENIFSMMNNGKSTICNIRITDNGVRIVAEQGESSVFIDAFLNKKMFSHYTPDPQCRSISMSVHMIQNQFACMRNLDTAALIMRGDSDGVALKAMQPTQAPMTMTVCETADEPMMLPPPDFLQPKVNLDFDAKHLCTTINQMLGENFTIKVDTVRKLLIVSSVSDYESVEIPIRLGEEANKECLKHAEIVNYKATFKKSNFHPVFKGTKLNNNVRISLEDRERPITIQYLIQNDYEEANTSMVTIIIVPQVDDVN